MAGFLVPPRLLEPVRLFLAGFDAALAGDGEKSVSARIALFAFSVPRRPGLRLAVSARSAGPSRGRVAATGGTP